MKAVVICADHGVLPSSAICSGLRKCGYEVIEYEHWSLVDMPVVDLCVIYGLRGQGQDFVSHYRRLNVPVVVVDHGYIERVNTPADYATGYWYIGLNGLGWLPDGVDGSRAALLTYGLKERHRRPIKRALITGQVAFDSSHRMGHAELSVVYQDMKRWLESYGLDVRFRGHPQAPELDPGIKHDDIRTLESALEHYDLVCTINSNSGLDAILAGLPVMITKPCHYQSCAYPFGHALAKVKPPSLERVRGLIDRLAWSQWLAKEIQVGLPFMFFQSRGLIP